MKSFFKKNKLALITLIAVLFLYGFFLTREVNLITADLGRHIINGQMILAGQTDVLNTNFYSYTESNFPVINHHWAAGVVFYLIFKVLGMSGLHLFFIILSLLALGIIFWFSQKRAGPGLALISTLLVSPLLAERTEIRPEVFSYVLAILFFILLWQYKEEKLKFKWLLISMVGLEILWVNLHIYFILGPALVISFLLAEVIKKNWGRVKRLGLALIGALTAMLINPFGLKGAAGLFLILQNYGYRLVENQPIWFIENLISNPNFTTFKIVFVLGFLTFLAIFIHKKEKFSWELLIVFTGFSLMGWLAIRNFAIFGLFMVPILALTLKEVRPLNLEAELLKNKILAWIGGVLVVFVLLGGFSPFFPQQGEFGLGLEATNGRAAEFIKQNNITGPIFNNYDIGGYLIFHLFPKERVFVDNRPEAYNESFLQDVYIKAQENNEKWQELLAEYNFNAIVFSHRDATPWGQNFLIERIDDPAWTPVFADQRVIVFLRRNEKNKPVIKQYEIPRDAFRVTQNQ